MSNFKIQLVRIFRAILTEGENLLYRYTGIRFPGRDCLDLYYVSRSKLAIVAPFSIPERYTTIHIDHRVQVLEPGVIHPRVKTLMVEVYTKDMILPDTLETLLIEDFDEDTPIPPPSVKNIFVHWHYEQLAHRLGTHWLCSGPFPLSESVLRRDLYDIEELNKVVKLGNYRCYAAKRIPKPGVVAEVTPLAPVERANRAMARSLVSFVLALKLMEAEFE